MNEKKVLDGIRKYTLWAVLGSAALLVILEILKAWDLIDTMSGGSTPDLGDLATNFLTSGKLSPDALNFSPQSPNVWGHIEATLAIILGLGSVSLLAILVSSRTKLGKGAGAKVAAAPAKAPVAAVATTKAASAKKAPAKPKK